MWPRRFPTLAEAAPFANAPVKLACRVYGGWMGNRLPLDGWTFRGSGGLCTTGRDGFRAVGHEETPDALRQPAPGIAAALIFRSRRGLNAAAQRDDIEETTHGVNGGLTGLADRRAYLTSCRRYLVSDPCGRQCPAAPIRAPAASGVCKGPVLCVTISSREWCSARWRS